MRVIFCKAYFVCLWIFLGGLAGASAQEQVVDVNSTANQGQSLADLARKVRKDQTTEVQMSDADAKKLFSSVDEILTFAAGDTGFPQKANVKRRLVSSADVEKYTREQEAKESFAQRFTRSELTLKKFGLLPRDFDLREFLVKANGKGIAAYYDFDTKTISMLNWIPLDKQKPILAHELTHALQDQNYNLKRWMKLDEKEQEPAAEARSNQDDDAESTARRAVVEGQAQVVYVDYVLAPFGRSVQNTPGLIYQMEEPAVQAVADSELLHNAPMIVREIGTFPYKAGLIFEGELLQKGGKAMAFAGAFAHPPRTTHEVLQPKAYLEHETLPPVVLPDLQSIVGSKYAVYDSGTIGELDLRALFEQYGERRAADELAAAWQGGRYVAFRRMGDGATSAQPTLADLALVYVSRWKSSQAAGRFAKIYATAVSQRYQNAAPDTAAACAGNRCPVALGQFSTETGPVIIEQWADNTVLVSESFDSTTAARLLNAVRDWASDTHADNFHSDELGLRLMEAPGFAAFQELVGEKVREQFKCNKVQ
jgi:hypothetical protein